MAQHKQLIIKLDVDQASDFIIDNFILNLTKFLAELYPEIKIPTKGWELDQKCQD